jgi:hypothetical protein
MRRVSSAFQADTVEYRGRIAGLPPLCGTAVMRRIRVLNSASVTAASCAGLASAVIACGSLSFTIPSQRSRGGVGIGGVLMSALATAPRSVTGAATLRSFGTPPSRRRRRRALVSD